MGGNKKKKDSSGVYDQRTLVTRMGDIQTIHELMMQSPVHRKWSADGFIRYVFPPLMLKQHYFTKDRRAWISWAFLSPEIADGFQKRTRHLSIDDWYSGDELWFIDMIAPYGNVRELMKDIRDTVFAGHPGGKWTRTFGTGKVQKIGFFERQT